MKYHINEVMKTGNLYLAGALPLHTVGGHAPPEPPIVGIVR